MTETRGIDNVRVVVAVDSSSNRRWPRLVAGSASSSPVMIFPLSGWIVVSVLVGENKHGIHHYTVIDILPDIWLSAEGERIPKHSGGMHSQSPNS